MNWRINCWPSRPPCAPANSSLQELRGAAELQGLGTGGRHAHPAPPLRLYNEVQTQITGRQDARCARREVATGQALLEALGFYATQVRQVFDFARSHLRRAHRPVPRRLRFRRLAELWAAPVGLMMVVMVALCFWPSYLFGAFAAIALLLLSRLFPRSVGLPDHQPHHHLSIIATLVIIYEYFWQLVILMVLAAGAYLLWENLREGVG
jgi:hypothetical protein